MTGIKCQNCGWAMPIPEPKKRKSKFASVADKFFSKVRKTETCWLWTSKGRVGGYGNFSVSRTKRVLAHRWSYEYHRGPIPAGLLVCHTCDVRDCVNPEHFFLGTHKDNADDAVRKGRWDPNFLQRAGAEFKRRQTRCKRGHPYSGDNLVMTKGRGRRCYECLLASQRKHDKKRRAPGMRSKNVGQKIS